MKKTYKYAFMMLALPFLSCLPQTACSDNSGSGNGGNGGNTGGTTDEEIVYQEVPVPPVAAATDESGYTVYYVDSGSPGNDANDGLSEARPFKTLQKINAMAKTPRMKVLLKSGAIFTGCLFLENHGGTQTAPFIVDKYGGADRPLIDAGGITSAVEIRDGNVIVRNIAVTNKSGNRGIFVSPREAGAMKNIVITGCRVEEVNWAGSDEVIGVNPSLLDVQAICSDARYAYSYGGIILEADTPPETGASWFENVFITANEIHKVARTGIWVNSMWARRPGIGWGYNDYVDDNNGWYPSRNVVIQNNDIGYTGGDGTVLIASRESFLDHNRVYHANYLGRSGFYNVALWPHSCIGCVMQYNEVAYTELENGGGDGEGLDVDIANINCLVQFNYVHHNSGGGILLCNGKTEMNGREVVGDHRGTVVRNNVFYENGKAADNPAFCVISSAVGKTDIYNNTVVVSGDRGDVMFVQSADWGNAGNSKEFTFRNNIFVALKPVSGSFVTDYIDNCTFENNLAYGISGNLSALDGDLHVFDPSIAIPPEPDGMSNGLEFVPGSEKTFREGILFNGMSEEDMAGNDAKGIEYLGAFCK